MYKVIDNKTSEELYRGYFIDECEEFIEWNKKDDCHIIEFAPCRGCREEEGYQRYDWYGMPTGSYCDECYENNYPYRKDRYDTIEFDGQGERLNDDY